MKGAVVAWAKTFKHGEWIIVLFVVAGRLENSFMPYASGILFAAQAITSVDTKSITPIAISKIAISTNFIYILLHVPENNLVQKIDC